jgi:hypothetical protein
MLTSNVGWWWGLFTSWICTVLAHWMNILLVDMWPHSDTLSWYRGNQSLFFLLNSLVLSGEATNTNFIVFGLTQLLRVILYFDWVTFLPVKLWWRRVFLHFRFVESRIPVIKYQQIYENQMYTQFNILVHLYYLGGECHIFHTLCIKNSSIFVHLYLSNRGNVTQSK